MSKTQNFEAASAPLGCAPFDVSRRSPAQADVPRRTPADEEVPCVISLAEIAAAFEPAEPGSEVGAPGLNTSGFRHPTSDFHDPPSDFQHAASDFQCPLGALASWRFTSSFAASPRLSLHSLRHRLRVRCQELLQAAADLRITPAWCHDAPTGCVLATVTLSEAEKIAELILFPNQSGEAADPNYQLSPLNHQLRLKLPGRLYIVQLDPIDKPLRVKIGFTTNLEKRLRAFRCIAPDARYFAHWPAEDFWERAATASITVKCRHLGGEVYEAASLEDLHTRAGSFLALMPKPATTPRFIPIPPRRPSLHLRFPHAPPVLNPNRNLNHNLPEAAQPPQTATREDASFLEERRLRARVFEKALGGAEAPPSPNFRRGKAAGGAEQTVATQTTVASLNDPLPAAALPTAAYHGPCVAPVSPALDLASAAHHEQRVVPVLSPGPTLEFSTVAHPNFPRSPCGPLLAAAEGRTQASPRPASVTSAALGLKRNGSRPERTAQERGPSVLAPGRTDSFPPSPDQSHVPASLPPFDPHNSLQFVAQNPPHATSSVSCLSTVSCTAPTVVPRAEAPGRPP